MTDEATPDAADSPATATSEGQARHASSAAGGSATLSPVSASGLDALGSAAWAAAVVGLLVALPGALRAGSAGLSMPLAWLALMGGSAALLMPLALGLRRLAATREGVPSGIALSVLVAGVGLAAPLCSVLMRVLKTSTNHRPLGAATYSMLALIVGLGLLAFVSRLGVWAAASDGSGVFSGKRSLSLLRGLAGLGALGLCYAALPVLGASGMWLLEGLVLLGGAAALALLGLPRVSGPLARAGLGVWLLVVLGCCAVLLSWPSEGVASLQRVAPVALGLGWLF